MCGWHCLGGPSGPFSSLSQTPSKLATTHPLNKRETKAQRWAEPCPVSHSTCGKPEPRPGRLEVCTLRAAGRARWVCLEGCRTLLPVAEAMTAPRRPEQALAVWTAPMATCGLSAQDGSCLLWPGLLYLAKASPAHSLIPCHSQSTRTSGPSKGPAQEGVGPPLAAPYLPWGPLSSGWCIVALSTQRAAGLQKPMESSKCPALSLPSWGHGG